MLSQEFIDQMKARLLTEKAKFEQDLAGLSKHTEFGSEPDENAQEVEHDMVSINSISQLKADLAKVNAALEKIEQGTYGTTEDGQQIPEERLNAIPWADSVL